MTTSFMKLRYVMVMELMVMVDELANTEDKEEEVTGEVSGIKLFA